MSEEVKAESNPAASKHRGTPLTQEEVEKMEGEWDADNFYVLKEGGFVDPYGYLFNKDGIDAWGGRYDEQGYYIPPPEAAYQMEEYDEDEEGEWHVDDSAATQEHILPAIKFLKEQPKDKKHTLKIAGLWNMLTETHVIKHFQNTFSGFKHDKIVVEKDKKGRSKGIAWLLSSDPESVAHVVNMHNHVFKGHTIATYLMGVVYTEEPENYDDDGEDDFDEKLEKHRDEIEEEYEKYRQEEEERL